MGTYVFLLNDFGIKLEVNVLDSLEIYSAHFTGRSQPVNQSLGHLQDLCHFWLILETFNILVAMCVAAFKELDEFLVQSLDNGQETSTNLCE